MNSPSLAAVYGWNLCGEVKRVCCVFSLMLLALATGCVSPGASARLTSTSGVFALTAEQADRAMKNAIRDAWTGKMVALELPDGRLGYEFTLWFTNVPDTMTIEALPEGSGYVFRVQHDRPAPFEGVPARERLVTLVSQQAERIERSTPPKSPGNTPVSPRGSTPHLAAALRIERGK